MARPMEPLLYNALALRTLVGKRADPDDTPAAVSTRTALLCLFLVLGCVSWSLEKRGAERMPLLKKKKKKQPPTPLLPTCDYADASFSLFPNQPFLLKCKKERKAMRKLFQVIFLLHVPVGLCTPTAELQLS